MCRFDTSDICGSKAGRSFVSKVSASKIQVLFKFIAAYQLDLWVFVSVLHKQVTGTSALQTHRTTQPRIISVCNVRCWARRDHPCRKGYKFVFWWHVKCLFIAQFTENSFTFIFSVISFLVHGFIYLFCCLLIHWNLHVFVFTVFIQK